MTQLAAWLNTPIGQFVRDIVEGGVAGAIAAVLALNLDVATPRGIALAATAGFISAVIAVARRRLIATQLAPVTPPNTP